MSDSPGAQEGSPQAVLLTHTVLIGATPLIPVPFVDDAARGYFERSLVVSLAEHHEAPMTPEEVASLLDRGERGCCARGCCQGALLYPLKRILRKILFILEWKRAVDLASETFVRGYLLDRCLAQKWWEPTGDAEAAKRVAQAIREAALEAGTSPVEHAIGGTFRGARSGLRSLAGFFGGSVMQRDAENEDSCAIGAALEKAEVQESGTIQAIVDSLRRTLQEVPRDYFENLEQDLWSRLQEQCEGPH